MELKSVYKRGAEYGWKFGLYLSALFFAIVYSSQLPFLAYIGMFLLLLIPFVVYGFLRRCYILEGGTSSFSTLWMLGILIFIYGSLICGIVTYVWLQYVMPNYIYDSAQAFIKLYESMPEMKNSEGLKVMRMAVDQKMLPSAIEFVFNMIWFTTFFGSVLSIFESLAARMRGIGSKKF